VVARPIAALGRVSAGLVRLLTASTNAVLLLVGQRGRTETSFVSPDEVMYLVREGASKGVFEPVEEQLVRNVFEFADTTVRQVMVPAINVRGLPVDTPPDQVLAVAASLRHSRLPVYEGSIEHPAGVVTVLDLLAATAGGRALSLPTLVRPVLFIPETARISVALHELQRTHQGLALVVDEFGQVVGLVTIEDMVEEIVGDIRDDQGASGAEPRLFRLPDGAYIVDGSTPIRQLREALGISLEESAHYVTIAGALIDALNAIPSPGASIVVDGWRFTAIETHGPRVTKVRVEPITRPA
jgi:putative hemolysin